MSSKDPDIISIVPCLPKTPDHILLSLFPDYKGVQSGDSLDGDSVIDSSKQTGEPAISIKHIKKEIPYMDLKVLCTFCVLRSVNMAAIVNIQLPQQLTEYMQICCCEWTLI